MTSRRRRLFNILGILLALVTAELSRGHGLLVGWESAAGAAGLTVALLLLGWPLAPMVRGRLAFFRALDAALAAEPGSDEQRKSLVFEQDRFLRRVGFVRRGYDAVTMGAFALACFVFGWPDFVASLGVPHGLEVLPELAPYLLMLCAAWVNHWRVEREVRSGWKLSSFMGFNLRGNLMMLAPVVLVSGTLFGLRAAFVEFDDAMNCFQFLQLVVQMAMMLLIVLFLPATIRFILPSARLPEGPLRSRLVAFATSRKLGVREIYNWNTRSRHIATAFVIGLVGPLRYVFITDALLRQLNEDEIEAVFAHELGHAHYNHLWWLLLFLFTISIVLLGVANALGALGAFLSESVVTPGLLDASSFAPLAFTLLYVYVVFGYVSRRFERQADFFAVAHTGPEILARVFLKLGTSSGHDLSKRGWRHFSLEQRIKEILLVAARPEVKRLFSRELFVAMAVAVLITLACAAALWPSVREDFVTGQMSYAFVQYDRARVGRADASRLEALRARVLERAENVRELDDHNRRLALLYEGVLDVLSGNNDGALAQTRAAFEAESRQAENKEKGAYFKGLLDLAEKCETAARRARAKGTPWEDELDKELKPAA